MDNLITSLDNALKNIDQGGVMVTSSLQTINVTLKQASGYQLRRVIEYLGLKGIDLLDIIIENSKAYKAYTGILEQIGPLSSLSEQVLDSFMIDGISYQEHITIRTEILKRTLLLLSIKYQSFAYEILCNIWDIFVKQSVIPLERAYAFELMNIILWSKPIFPDNLENFKNVLRDKIDRKILLDEKHMTDTDNEFDFFMNMFLLYNQVSEKISIKAAHRLETSKIHINVLPNEIEGTETLWEYIWRSKNQNSVAKGITFFCHLFLNLKSKTPNIRDNIIDEYLSKCQERLEVTLRNRDQVSEAIFTESCLKYLKFINYIIDNSPEKGNENLSLHFQPKDNKPIMISVCNDINRAPDIPKQVEISITPSTGLIDLLIKIEKHFKTPWYLINVPNIENCKGKTLREIGLQTGSMLRTEVKDITTAHAKAFLQDKNILNPLLKDILTEIFHKYSEEGKMSPEKCAQFIHSCSGDNCQPEDMRVERVFSDFDDDNDGYLTLENFLAFYRIACSQRPHIVWLNLFAQGYNHEFSKFGEQEEEEVDITSLLRYIISTSDEYFKKIFLLLDFEDKVANQALALLNRIPTGARAILEIIQLNSSQKLFDSMFDIKSRYKLVYTLQIIDILTKYNVNDKRIKQIENILLSYDPDILEKIQAWKIDFITRGGLDHLLKLFESLQINPSHNLDSTDRNTLFSIFGILKNSLSKPLESYSSHLDQTDRNLSSIILFHDCANYLQNYFICNPVDRRIYLKNQRIEETAGFRSLTEKLKQDLSSQFQAIDCINDFLNTTLILWKNIVVKENIKTSL